jgi:hypothetical protein
MLHWKVWFPVSDILSGVMATAVDPPVQDATAETGGR